MTYLSNKPTSLFDDKDSDPSVSNGAYVLRIFKGRYPSFANHLERLKKDEYAAKMFSREWRVALERFDHATIAAALGRSHESHPDKAPSLVAFKWVCNSISPLPECLPISNSTLVDLDAQIKAEEHNWVHRLSGDEKIESWKRWKALHEKKSTIEMNLRKGMQKGE